MHDCLIASVMYIGHCLGQNGNSEGVATFQGPMEKALTPFLCDLTSVSILTQKPLFPALFQNICWFLYKRDLKQFPWPHLQAPNHSVNESFAADMSCLFNTGFCIVLPSLQPFVSLFCRPIQSSFEEESSNSFALSTIKHIMKKPFFSLCLPVLCRRSKKPTLSLCICSENCHAISMYVLQSCYYLFLCRLTSEAISNQLLHQP